MELKSLFLGLLFATGIFALKCGCGLHYISARQRTLAARLGIVLGFAFVYLVLFVGSWRICREVDALRCFNSLRVVFQSGMLLHVVLAGGLLVWGLALLKRKLEPASPHGQSAGWIALVVPCPLCASVVFVTVAFLVSAFPEDSLRAVLGAYLLFVTVGLLTIGGLHLWGRTTGAHPESILGTSMLLISAYFFLSAVLMPQFGDLDKVYRLAAYHGDKQVVNAGHWVALFSIVLACMGGGFWFGLKRIRRVAS